MNITNHAMNMLSIRGYCLDSIMEVINASKVLGYIRNKYPMLYEVLIIIERYDQMVYSEYDSYDCLVVAYNPTRDNLISVFPHRIAQLRRKKESGIPVLDISDYCK